MSSTHRRRDRRYHTQLPISLKTGSKVRQLLTHNVSFRGLFLRTDDPPPLRSLIHVEASLPPGEVPFSSHAMAVWIVSPAEATDEQPPGVGVQFYAMGSERNKWESFILYTRKTADTSDDATPVPLPKPPLPPDAIRRAYPRRSVRLPVRPRTVHELITMYTRDVSSGGMFVLTDRAFDMGTILGLEVSHPETHKVFEIDAVVRRIEVGDNPGIGVEFVEMTDDVRDSFHKFVHSTIEELGVDELDFVEENDVQLE